MRFGTKGIKPLAQHRIFLGLRRIAEAVKSLDSRELRADGDEGLVSFKNYGLSRAILSRDLGSQGDNHGGKIVSRKRKRQFGSCRAGGFQFDANELQELDVIAIGNLIQPVDQNFCHPRKQFHESDAGIAFVEVGPFRGIAGDQRFCFRDDVRELAIIQIGGGKRHPYSPGPSVR